MQGKNNKMEVGDVTAETKIFISNGYKIQGSRIVSVSALKPCGCDGPWIGKLKAIPYAEWSDAARDARDKLGHNAKCWAIYPVTKDGYSTFKNPVGWAFGKTTAANLLLEFIAQRNRTGR